MKKIIAYILVVMAIAVCTNKIVYAEPKTHHIKIKKFNFYPPEPLITTGDTVVWENKMRYGHWVISGVDMRHDNKFFSYLLLNGHKFSYTFRRAGEYPYYCPIHSMQAVVSVVDPKGAKSEASGEENNTRRRRR